MMNKQNKHELQSNTFEILHFRKKGCVKAIISHLKITKLEEYITNVFRVQKWIESDFASPSPTPSHFSPFSALLCSLEGSYLQVFSLGSLCFAASCWCQEYQAVRGPQGRRETQILVFLLPSCFWLYFLVATESL